VRLDESARGVFVISVTPFHEDGELDLDGTPRLAVGDLLFVSECNHFLRYFKC